MYFFFYKNEKLVDFNILRLIQSSVPKKISQKERRKLIQKQEVSESSTTGSSKSVWGKVASVDPIPLVMDTVEVPDQDKKGKKM